MQLATTETRLDNLKIGYVIGAARLVLINQMSRVVRNRSSGFPIRFDTYRDVQPQMMARGLKFRI